MSSKNRNRTLDAFKGIACILIVFIHRRFPGGFGETVSGIARSGVALFFIISGYYCFYYDREKQLQMILKKLQHIIYLLLYSLIFYLIWESFVRWVGSGLPSVVDWLTTHLLSFNTLFTTVVWDVDPLAGHLWFLFALIKTYCLFYLVSRFNLLDYTRIIVIVLFLILFASECFDVEMHYYRNGWIYGLSFFLLGYIIREKSVIILHPIIFFLIGILLTITESHYFPLQQLYLGNVLICVSAFSFALTHQLKPMPGLGYLSELGRKYSLFIYVLHWAIKEIFIKIDKTFPFAQETWYLWSSPVLLVIVSVLVSMAVFTAVKHRGDTVRKHLMA